jgi:hypothetical protein
MTAVHESATATPSAPQRPAGRSFLVVGFVLTTLFTSVVTVGGSFLLGHYQAIETDQLQQTNKFIETTRGFDLLMAKFNDDLAHGRNTDADRAAIDQNVLQQHQMLTTVSAYLPRDRQQLADHYGDNLVNIHAQLQRAPSITEAGPLEQEVEYAVRSRQLLNSELQRRAGLPARGDDAPAG